MRAPLRHRLVPKLLKPKIRFGVAIKSSAFVALAFFEVARINERRRRPSRSDLGAHRRTMWVAFVSLRCAIASVSELLSVPTAGFLVRLFMIQHDCGHGAFFRQRVVNLRGGRCEPGRHAAASRRCGTTSSLKRRYSGRCCSCCAPTTTVKVVSGTKGEGEEFLFAPFSASALATAWPFRSSPSTPRSTPRRHHSPRWGSM